jgi:hypothetical protein
MYLGLRLFDRRVRASSPLRSGSHRRRCQELHVAEYVRERESVGFETRGEEGREIVVVSIITLVKMYASLRSRFLSFERKTR